MTFHTTSHSHKLSRDRLHSVSGAVSLMNEWIACALSRYNWAASDLRGTMHCYSRHRCGHSHKQGVNVDLAVLCYMWSMQHVTLSTHLNHTNYSCTLSFSTVPLFTTQWWSKLPITSWSLFHSQSHSRTWTPSGKLLVYFFLLFCAFLCFSEKK